jgi:hypothetical protein
MDGAWPHTYSLLGALPGLARHLVCDAVEGNGEAATEETIADFVKGAADIGICRQAELGKSWKAWSERADLDTYRQRGIALVDRDTCAAVMYHRAATVRNLCVDSRPVVAARQFEAFPNLTHLHWRSRDREQRSLLHHVSTRPAVFDKVLSLALNEAHPGVPKRLDHPQAYRCLGDAFPNLAVLQVDHKVGRADLATLQRCERLRVLKLRDADEDTFASPCVLPGGLTQLRVLGYAGQGRKSPLSGWGSLQELYMPQLNAYIHCVDDLARLARLRVVMLRGLGLELWRHGSEDRGQGQDLPSLSWTHVGLSAWDMMRPLLPVLPALEVAVFNETLLLPKRPEVAQFLEVHNALRGRFYAPKTLWWVEAWEEPPELEPILHAVLSNAADQPDKLRLVNLRLDRSLLGALTRHAPQLRRLILQDCTYDPVAVECMWSVVPCPPALCADYPGYHHPVELILR